MGSDWKADPTCGVPLQKVAKTIAIIDVVTSAISLGSLLFVGLILIMEGSSLAETAEMDRANFPAFADFMQLGTGVIVIIFLSLIAVATCYIFLARFLMHGVMERNYEKVSLWYKLTIALLALRVIYYVIGITMSSPDIGIPSIFGVLGFIYQMYCLWVVKCYRTELKRTGEAEKFRYGPLSFHSYTSEQI